MNENSTKKTVGISMLHRIIRQGVYKLLSAAFGIFLTISCL